MYSVCSLPRQFAKDKNSLLHARQLHQLLGLIVLRVPMTRMLTDAVPNADVDGAAGGVAAVAADSNTVHEECVKV